MAAGRKKKYGAAAGPLAGARAAVERPRVGALSSSAGRISALSRAPFGSDAAVAFPHGGDAAGGG